MAWFRTHKKPKPGQPISARDARKIAETADYVSSLRADAPLSVMATFTGPLIRYIGQVFGAYIVFTNGTITARSGLTPGTGNIDLYGWNGTTLVSLGVTLPCYSISSTIGGIPPGTCGVTLKIFGALWLVTLDCGN